MRFYVQAFVCPILFIQVSITTTLFRGQYLSAFEILRKNDAKLKLIEVVPRIKYHPTIAIYMLLFLSASAALTADIHYFSDKYVWPYFACQYIPSLVIAVYVLTIAMLMEMCGDKFEAINVYLQQFTMNDEKIIKKYYLNKRSEYPPKLLELFPNHRVTIFQMVFNIFDAYVDNVRLLNSLFGFDLVVFLVIVTVDILSFVYDVCMDIGQYINGYSMPMRSIYAIEYWSVVWMFALIVLIDSSSELMRKSNQTRYFLHQLRNLYPKLEKHVNCL